MVLRNAAHQLYIFLGLILCLIFLSACESTATPIAAVSVPTVEPQEFVDVTQAPPLRYGIADHTLPYVDDIAVVQEIALVEALPPNPDLSPYDVAIAYGRYEGWQESPIQHTVALIINPNLSPVPEMDFVGLLRQTLNFDQITTNTGISGIVPRTASENIPSPQIRGMLANAGYPDGIQLVLATEPIPAGSTLIEQLNSANLTTRTITLDESAEVILAENRAHGLLMRWTQDSERAEWVERVGENHVIELYTLPISYVAVDGITVSFTENGFPIGSR